VLDLIGNVQRQQANESVKTVQGLTFVVLLQGIFGVARAELRDDQDEQTA
jgi:hypothetical protein